MSKTTQQITFRMENELVTKLKNEAERFNRENETNLSYTDIIRQAARKLVQNRQK